MQVCTNWRACWALLASGVTLKLVGKRNRRANRLPGYMGADQLYKPTKRSLISAVLDVPSVTDSVPKLAQLPFIRPPLLPRASFFSATMQPVQVMIDDGPPRLAT